MQRRNRRRQGGVDLVLIPTQPDRLGATCRLDYSANGRRVFQSAPNREAGCNWGLVGFNSHPISWLGAT